MNLHDPLLPSKTLVIAAINLRRGDVLCDRLWQNDLRILTEARRAHTYASRTEHGPCGVLFFARDLRTDSIRLIELRARTPVRIVRGLAPQEG